MQIFILLIFSFQTFYYYIIKFFIKNICLLNCLIFLIFLIIIVINNKIC